MTKAIAQTPLSDAQLVATFLRARRGKSATDRANEIMEHCGEFHTLLNKRSKSVELLTDAEHKTLQHAIEIATRYTMSKMETQEILSSPEDVRNYFALKLAGLEYEAFVGLFLDNRHRIIEYRELFRGTIDSAAVYPREVVKHCLSCNAAAIIFGHPHPSGVAEPSDSDVRLTRKLKDALALIDVRVLDHLVIGHGVQTSLAERGLM